MEQLQLPDVSNQSVHSKQDHLLSELRLFQCLVQMNIEYCQGWRLHGILDNLLMPSHVLCLKWFWFSLLQGAVIALCLHLREEPVPVITVTTPLV